MNKISSDDGKMTEIAVDRVCDAKCYEKGRMSAEYRWLFIILETFRNRTGMFSKCVEAGILLTAGLVFDTLLSMSICFLFLMSSF